MPGNIHYVRIRTAEGKWPRVDGSHSLEGCKLTEGDALPPAPRDGTRAGLGTEGQGALGFSRGIQTGAGADHRHLRDAKVSPRALSSSGGIPPLTHTSAESSPPSSPESSTHPSGKH